MKKELCKNDYEFVEITSKSFVEGKTLDEYKLDVIRWLMLGWDYNLEHAIKRVTQDDCMVKYIEESYYQKLSIEEVAVDVGYCCG